ncbi:MAG: Asp23/Gls24 family envelope stress response protein [Mycobacteriales bacterium]
MTPKVAEREAAAIGRLEPTDLPAVADAIAAVVVHCRGVVGLHGGRFGEAATYLPGRRVHGVEVTESAVTVHIVARLGAVLPTVAAAVRRVVVPLAGGVPVHVVVEDVVAGSAKERRRGV